MTREERNAYHREWNRKNKEKLKQYKLNTYRNAALKDINSGKVELVQVQVLREKPEAV